MGVFKWLSGEDNAVVGSLESIQALDASSANLLILDNQCNIVVANKAAKVRRLPGLHSQPHGFDQ